MKIRPLKLSDFDHMDFTLRLREQPEARIKHPHWPNQESLNRDRDVLINPRMGRCIVAEAEHRVIGFCGCIGSVAERTNVLLYGPVVLPEMRRQGIATDLLRTVLDQAAGIYPKDCIFSAWVDPENAGARRSLETHGFSLPYSEWFMAHEGSVSSPRNLPRDCRVFLSHERTDVDAVYEIYLGAWSGRKSAHSFYSDIKTGPNGLFLLIRKGQPIAFFILLIRASGNADIEYFAVHPFFRSRGYGSLLMEHAIPIIRQKVCPQGVALTVHTTNHHAIHLYERAGFRKMYSMEMWEKRVV